jgi:hypothetical protein
VAISLKHAFVSPIVDAAEADIVGPDEWNDEHDLTQATSTILGRITAGTGATEELTATQVRTLINVEDGATADQSAAEILAALLTVDGSGSGLDADLLDGNSSAAFALSATTITAGAGLTGGGDLSANRTVTVGAGTGITVNPDDVALTVPVAVSSGGTGQTTEAEAVGELIQALTEDTAPDVTADYVGTYDASADTGKKVKLANLVREKLTANRTYYVRTDGSDSNTGLVDSAGGAWLTLQHAWDTISLTLEQDGYTVTIDIGDGTYASVTAATLVTGPVTFNGNTTTPSNVLITVNSGYGINVNAGVPYTLRFLGLGFSLNANFTTCINLVMCPFVLIEDTYVDGNSHTGLVFLEAAYNVTAFVQGDLKLEDCGFTAVLRAQYRCTMTFWPTFTYTGTVTFTDLLSATEYCSISYYHYGVTGSATGREYTLSRYCYLEDFGQNIEGGTAGVLDATCTLSSRYAMAWTVGSDGALTVPGLIKSSDATDGIGYATGAGGTVTQGTSRTTGVTLNKASGAITLFSAAGSTTPATFTVTNSAVAATDTIVVNQKSGTDLYHLLVTAVAAGSFNLTFFTTGGTTTEQPVFNFAVIKAVAA